MKKVITIMVLFGLLLVQAQVGINTDTPHDNSDLELGSSNKALLLNRVASETDITTVVEGMIIFDATEHCFKGYQNSAWVDITSCTVAGGGVVLNCSGATFSPTVASVNTAYNGTLSITYSGGNGEAYSSQSISSTGVTGLTATITAGTLANGGGTLEYSVSGTASATGTASFAINIGGQSCTVSLNVAEAFPPTITLHGDRYFVSSVYDTDYLPYTAPTAPATIDTNQAADGIADPTIDIQGKITTTGISVTIPFTATGSGTLPAYSTTINIPSNMTQDGISRDITLSWIAQAYTTANTSINATIKAVGGDLLAKKLDIQTGIGNDALGVLMGTFSIPSNSSGAMVNYEVRNIAGIPDLKFGNGTHDFLYLPVEVTGTYNVNGQPYKKTWLSMNLGADYAKVGSPDFNLGVIKTGSAAHNDTKTYGSLFQWQRKAEGHEFRSSQTTSNLASTWTAENINWNGKFITTTSTYEYNWVVSGQNDVSGPETQYWQSGGANNPCPNGYHIPTFAEWSDLHEAVTGSRTFLNGSNVFYNQSILPNFATAGKRRYENGLLEEVGIQGYYWASDSYLSFGGMSVNFNINYSGPDSNNIRSTGFSTRCVQD